MYLKYFDLIKLPLLVIWKLTSRQWTLSNDSASISSGPSFLGETCCTNCPDFCWSNWQSALPYRWLTRQTSSLVTNDVRLWWWQVHVSTVRMLICSLIDFYRALYFKLTMLVRFSDLRLEFSEAGFFMPMFTMTVSWYWVSLSWCCNVTPTQLLFSVTLIIWILNII